MQTSSQPKLLPIPFADGGSKQDIPNDSQIGIAAGRASYNDGFPPLTRTPLAAGGVPPFGTDFNGVFNDITAAIRWSQAGAGYPFNAAFNTAVAGYPKGARIPNSALDGFWLNTTDGNSANPENTTSSLTGWIPSGVYGVTTITGLSGSSVTLTTLQASKDRITLAGTLTANINLVVPAWVKSWDVVNNCGGAYSVTIKTPSGNGVQIPNGLTAYVVGNGVDILQDNALLGNSGRLLNVQQFTSTGTYNPTPGAKKIIVEVWGAGGGGGGAAATGASTVAVGNSGGGGAYSKGQYLNPTTTNVTVGIGGAGGAVGANNGNSGGASSFGSFIVCAGGTGGFGGTAQSVGYVTGVTSGGLVTTSGNILNIGGGTATQGFTINTAGLIQSLPGGASGVPVGPTSVGCGGYGAWSKANYVASGGANGINGAVIIWEYA